MKEKKSLWDKLPVLIGAVIAVLAFVRGSWTAPLLMLVFGIWGLWAALSMGELPRFSFKGIGQKVSRTEECQQPEQSEPTEQRAEERSKEMEQILLRHVNHQVSEQLIKTYPNVRWEWVARNPALLALHGGIGRIRLYGVPDYEYADVELETSGKVTCCLVMGLSVPGGQQTIPPPPNQQDTDLSEWYELHGRQTLELLIADLDSRGHSCLTLKEDGSICIQPMDGGEETVEGNLDDFPEKSEWSELVMVLEQTGLAATARENCITVAW